MLFSGGYGDSIAMNATSWAEYSLDPIAQFGRANL